MDLMTMSLYQLTMEGEAILEMLQATDGELTPDLEAQFDEFLRAGKEKMNAAACVVRNLEANATVCKTEGDRLYDRAAMFMREADALKARMLAAVDAAFDGKVKTPLFTIWGQTSAPTISFEIAADADLAKLAESDPDLVRSKLELNKQRCIELHKGGDALPREVAVMEKPGTRYLRIK